MRAWLSIILLCGSFALAQQPAQSNQQAQPAAADAAVEARLLHLTEELRCLVCQNETLAASHADLAIDLKNQIREQIKAGKSDRQIIDYLVARYGDFVLYRPPLKASTVALWVGPFVLLLAGLFLMVRQLKTRQRGAHNDVAPSDGDLLRAQQLLSGSDPRS